MSEIISQVLVFVGGIGFGIYLAVMRERNSSYRKRRARFEKKFKETEDRIEQGRNEMMGGTP